MSKNKEANARSARPTCGREQKISDQIVELAESVQKRVNQNFGALLAERGMRNVDMLNELYPIIRDDQHISKLMSGSQHVTLAILVVLHYVFSVDLNKFIAGDTSSQTTIPLDIQKAADLLARFRSGFQHSK